MNKIIYTSGKKLYNERVISRNIAQFLYSSLFYLFFTIINKLFGISPIVLTLVYNAFVVCILVQTISKSRCCNYLTVLVVSVIVALIYLSVWLIYPNNFRYFESSLITIIRTCLVPAFLFGCASSYDQIILYIKKLSSPAIVFVLAIEIMYIAGLAKECGFDYQAISYEIALPIIVYFYVAMKTNSIMKTVLSIVSILLLVVIGCRGVILIVGIISIVIVISLGSEKSAKNKIASTTIIVLITLTIVMFYNQLTSIMTLIFSKIGFAYRFSSSSLINSLFNSTERIDIYKYLFSCINRKPIAGYGIFGDRYLMSLWKFATIDGAYSHNLLIEFFADYGYLFGTIFALTLCSKIVKTIRVASGEQKAFVVMLIIYVMVKLSVSGSYLIEPYFYVLCVILLKKRKDNLEV